MESYREPPTAPERRLVSLQDAAAYLGISPLTVRRMISAGQLQGFRVGTGQRALVRVDMAQIDDELLRPIPAAQPTE